MGTEEAKKIVEVLVNEIKRTAEAEVKEILERARKQADEIIKEARERASIIRERKIEQIRKRIREQILKDLAKKRVELRRNYLERKNKIIQELIDTAIESCLKLVKEKHEKYKNGLINLIIEGIQNINDENITIACNKEDREIIEKLIPLIREKVEKQYGKKVNLILANENINCIGGVILYNSDKTEYFNNTIEARIEKLRNEVIADIFKKYGIVV